MTIMITGVPYGTNGTNLTALVVAFTTTCGERKGWLYGAGKRSNGERLYQPCDLHCNGGRRIDRELCCLGKPLGGVGLQTFSAGTAQYTSLAIDPSGTPYIAYQDVANGSKATVMKYTNGSWQIVGTAGFSAGAVDSDGVRYSYLTALAFDPSGTPYFAYQDNGNGGKATVMKYASGSWQVVGAAGFTTAEVKFSPLRLI